MKNLFLILFFAIFLTGCSTSDLLFFQKNDTPIERKTITGTIYPFEVSIVDGATHRIEKDEKTIGFLFSNIVDLNDYVGEKILIRGNWKKGSRWDVFWVEEVDLTEPIIERNSKDDYSYSFYDFRDYAFLYPVTWSYSLIDQKAYFVEKNDVNARAFFNFEATKVTEEDRKKVKKVNINGLLGYKEIKTNNVEDVETLVLFNKNETQKYVFTLFSAPDELDKKQAFLKILNSFVIEDKKVQIFREKFLIDKESFKKQNNDSKQKDLKEAFELPNTEKTEKETEKKKEVSEKDLIPEDLPEVKNTEENVNEKTLKEQTKKISIDFETPTDFLNELTWKNKIDNRGFPYQSSFLNLKLIVPFGLWFQNFGSQGTRGTLIGMRNKPIDSKNDLSIEIWILTKKDPTKKVLYKEIEDGKIEVVLPRTERSEILISGDKKFRDFIISLASTVRRSQ